MGPQAKRTAVNLLLLVSSLGIAVIVSEACLRLFKPFGSFNSAEELWWFRKSDQDQTKIFTIDPDFGFRPILGTGLYNEYGTGVNGYSLEKRPEVKRLLFIGDSVTAREDIVDALKLVYGEEKFEYWNAGVESFNTVQEVNFYKKYNSRIKPDHVILTFHTNDFETTPVVFFNKGKLVVYAPKKPLREISPRLFKNSYLYRIYLGITSPKEDLDDAIIDETRQSLAELKDILDADNIELTVLVLPILSPYGQWTDEERKSRATIIMILKGLHIRHFDLLPVMHRAIADGVNIRQYPFDAWHPSAEVSMYFAKYLYAHGLLR